MTIGLAKDQVLYHHANNDDTNEDSTSKQPNAGDVTAKVGVQYFKATKDHPPIRLYYPARTSPMSSTTESSAMSTAEAPGRASSNVSSKSSSSSHIGLSEASTEDTIINSTSIRWLEDTGCYPFLKGYAHLAFGMGRSPTPLKRFVFQFMVLPVLFLFSWVLPLRWLRIPNAYANLLPSSSSPQSVSNNNNKTDENDATNARRNTSSPSKSLPIILFSHGLTGTGEENKVLLIEWAKQGFVVISVHHTDGSSCHVTVADGSDLFYNPGPPFSDYDPTFRPKQVQQRSKELLDAYQFIISSSKDNNVITIPNVDCSSPVFVAGFSYGAATAALAVTQNPDFFKGAILLDGWFHIDVTESAGIAFKMPPEAFEFCQDNNDNNSKYEDDENKGSKNRHGGGFPTNIPTIFINSEQFSKYHDLFAATKELAQRYQPKRAKQQGEHDGGAKDVDNLHVIPGTGHQNFCDVVFWFPVTIVRKLIGGAIGPADPIQVYKEIIRLSVGFLKKEVAAS